MHSADFEKLFRGACRFVTANDRITPYRFTEAQTAALHRLSEGYGRLARCAAGIWMEFETDAAEISFSCRTEDLYTSIGGFDFYEDGVLTETVALPQGSSEMQIRYRKKASGKVRMRIYLPANAEVTLWDLSLGDWAFAPMPEGPSVLFYGDSITQSAYITEPSLSFAARVGRRLDALTVNRGIGSLYYDASVLDPEGDPVCPQIVFSEYGANDLVRRENGEVVYSDGLPVYFKENELEPQLEKAEEFLKRLRSIYSNARIIVITLLWSTAERKHARLYEAYRSGIEKIAERLQLQVLSGSELVPHDERYFVKDGTHLNAEGNRSAAAVISERLMTE